MNDKAENNSQKQEIQLTAMKIVNTSKEIKNKAAMRPRRISTEVVMKNGPRILHRMIHQMFQKTINGAQFP